MFHSEENISKNQQTEQQIEMHRVNSTSLNISLNETSTTSLNNREKSKLGQTYLNIEYVKEYIGSLLGFFQRQSYLISLISMMVFTILKIAKIKIFNIFNC